MKEFSVLKSGIPVNYSFNNNTFFIDSPLSIDPHFIDSLQHKNILIDYSKTCQFMPTLQDILLYNENGVDRVRICSERLVGYHPLILMKSNFGIYNQQECDRIKNNYFQFISQEVHILSEFYKCVVSEYQKFIDKTGFYFFDISSNNIMINQNNLIDFKVIDFLSMKKVDFTEQVVDPASVLIYHNVVKHQVTNLEHLINKCRTFYNFLTPDISFEQVLDKVSSIDKIKLIGKTK